MNTHVDDLDRFARPATSRERVAAVAGIAALSMALVVAAASGVGSPHRTSASRDDGSSSLAGSSSNVPAADPQQGRTSRRAGRTPLAAGSAVATTSGSTPQAQTTATTATAGSPEVRGGGASVTVGAPSSVPISLAGSASPTSVPTTPAAGTTTSVPTAEPTAAPTASSTDATSAPATTTSAPSTAAATPAPTATTSSPASQPATGTGVSVVHTVVGKVPAS